MAEKEEIDRLKAQTVNAKTALERRLGDLRFKVKAARSDMEKDLPRLEKLKLQKQLNSLIEALKQGEQNLFMDSLKLHIVLEEKIKALLDAVQLGAETVRIFVINVTGNRLA